MPDRTDENELSSDLAGEIDALSLQQALVDFEIANARVIDLTHRLVEATTTINELRGELDQTRSEHAELLNIHNRMQSSRAFRLADKIWNLRHVLGV